MCARAFERAVRATTWATRRATTVTRAKWAAWVAKTVAKARRARAVTDGGNSLRVGVLMVLAPVRKDVATISHKRRQPVDKIPSCNPSKGRSTHFAMDDFSNIFRCRLGISWDNPPFVALPCPACRTRMGFCIWVIYRYLCNPIYSDLTATSSTMILKTIPNLAFLNLVLALTWNRFMPQFLWIRAYQKPDPWGLPPTKKFTSTPDKMRSGVDDFPKCSPSVG